MSTGDEDQVEHDFHRIIKLVIEKKGNLVSEYTKVNLRDMRTM